MLPPPLLELPLSELPLPPLLELPLSELLLPPPLLELPLSLLELPLSELPLSEFFFSASSFSFSAFSLAIGSSLVSLLLGTNTVLPFTSMRTRFVPITEAFTCTFVPFVRVSDLAS